MILWTSASGCSLPSLNPSAEMSLPRLPLSFCALTLSTQQKHFQWIHPLLPSQPCCPRAGLRSCHFSQILSFSYWKTTAYAGTALPSFLLVIDWHKTLLQWWTVTKKNPQLQTKYVSNAHRLHIWSTLDELDKAHPYQYILLVLLL